ncbi:MAG: hypothetical protein H0V88_01885 [Pyrinomonadaceae bacterium]|nr:hypothetical protein [Pyrinomonadaceae bacterium]
MEIDGTWNVRYVVRQQPPFTTEEGDADEVAKVILDSGKVSGRDPFGYEFSGEYSLNDETIKALIVATPYQSDAEPIFDDVAGQFILNLEGEYRSPNHFSMAGFIVGNPSQKIVLICNRASV